MATAEHKQNPLRAILDIHKGEIPLALFMFSYFFLVITSFWILKPIKKDLFIQYYDTSGFDLLAWNMTASQAELLAKILNMVVAYAAVVVFSWLAARYRRQQLTFIFSVFFLASYAAYTLALHTPGPFTVWSFYVLVVLAGYALFQAVPGNARIYGRFCDLNLGRVLAAIMAAASVGAVLTGWTWLQNLGFVAFAVFWLQGLAILHWLRAEQRLPVFVLVMAYALLPFLNVVLVISFAVLGYMDAWFDFRARAKLKDNRA